MARRTSTWRSSAGTKRRRVSRWIAAVVFCCATLAAMGHGASRGLHLHLSPDPATPGSSITVELEAEAPVRTVRLGFSGHESKQRELEEPTRRLSMTLKVPKAKTETLNCHAEVTTSAGKTLRSSAVLRLQQSKPRETRSGP